MARGRKKTSLRALRASGSKHAAGRNDPTLALGHPNIPSFIDDDALPHWQRCVEVLGARGVLTVGDGLAVGMLADALAQYVAAKAILAREGMIANGSTGNVIAHPAYKMMVSAWDRMFKIARECGMTPASRTSAPMAEAGTANPEEDELFGTA